MVVGVLCVSLSNSIHAQSFYDFKVKTLEGQVFDFQKLKGKKVMIVNTASKCKYTNQYEMLEILYQKYKDRLVVIGFPTDNFGNQEFGKSKDIRDFCTNNYEITFPLMTKIDVIPGKKHPVYKWLTDKKLNKVMDSEIKWNFQKYLISESGELEKVIEPGIKVYDKSILNWLQE